MIAITPRTRRARSDSRPSTAYGALGFEHVPGLPNGLDQRRAIGVELAAQVAHVGLDDVRVAAEVVPPDVLEDLALREHAAWVEHEEAKEVELGRREVDVLVAAEDLVAPLVEHEVAQAQHVAGQVAGGAAQDGLHAGDDLGEAERLGDVVVAAGAKRLDLVLDCALCGEEEDRGLEAALAEATAYLEPVDVGEHPVEDDQVGVELHRLRERVAAVLGLGDVEALVPQRCGYGIDDRRLVVDDEDRRAGGGIGGSVQRGHGRIVSPVPVGCL